MDWSKFERGVFLVNVLGSIYDPKTKKLLIGRRENDHYLTELSWTFPGGRPSYNDDLELYLAAEIKKKTGLDTKSKCVIFAKTYPEKREFLSIYYLCEVIGGQERAGEKFVELKWVRPEELRNYFTSTFHPKLEEILCELQ